MRPGAPAPRYRAPRHERRLGRRPSPSPSPPAPVTRSRSNVGAAGQVDGHGAPENLSPGRDGRRAHAWRLAFLDLTRFLTRELTASRRSLAVPRPARESFLGGHSEAAESARPGPVRPQPSGHGRRAGAKAPPKRYFAFLFKNTRAHLKNIPPPCLQRRGSVSQARQKDRRLALSSSRLTSGDCLSLRRVSVPLSPTEVCWPSPPRLAAVPPHGTGETQSWATAGSPSRSSRVAEPCVAHVVCIYWMFYNVTGRSVLI